MHTDEAPHLPNWLSDSAARNPDSRPAAVQQSLGPGFSAEDAHAEKPAKTP